eukprot:tig00000492_g1447.t1
MSVSVPATGPVSTAHLRAIFGITGPVYLSQLFKGGSYIASSVAGPNIPTSRSTMLMSYFRGASASARMEKVIFGFTGADQVWTVPEGVTSVTVKMWGAGGGGCSYAPSFPPGGGGGFVTGVLAVVPGAAYTIIVGGGGKNYGDAKHIIETEAPFEWLVMTAYDADRLEQELARPVRRTLPEHEPELDTDFVLPAPAGSAVQRLMFLLGEAARAGPVERARNRDQRELRAEHRRLLQDGVGLVPSADSTMERLSIFAQMGLARTSASTANDARWGTASTAIRVLPAAAPIVQKRRQTRLARARSCTSRRSKIAWSRPELGFAFDVREFSISTAIACAKKRAAAGGAPLRITGGWIIRSMHPRPCFSYHITLDTSARVTEDFVAALEPLSRPAPAPLLVQFERVALGIASGPCKYRDGPPSGTCLDVAAVCGGGGPGGLARALARALAPGSAEVRVFANHDYHTVVERGRAYPAYPMVPAPYSVAEGTFVFAALEELLLGSYPGSLSLIIEGFHLNALERGLSGPLGALAAALRARRHRRPAASCSLLFDALDALLADDEPAVTVQVSHPWNDDPSEPSRQTSGNVLTVLGRLLDRRPEQTASAHTDPDTVKTLQRYLGGQIRSAVAAWGARSSLVVGVTLEAIEFIVGALTLSTLRDTPGPRISKSLLVCIQKAANDLRLLTQEFVKGFARADISLSMVLSSQKTDGLTVHGLAEKVFDCARKAKADVPVPIIGQVCAAIAKSAIDFAAERTPCMFHDVRGPPAPGQPAPPPPPPCATPRKLYGAALIDTAVLKAADVAADFLVTSFNMPPDAAEQIRRCTRPAAVDAARAAACGALGGRSASFCSRSPPPPLAEIVRNALQCTAGRNIAVQIGRGIVDQLVQLASAQTRLSKEKMWRSRTRSSNSIETHFFRLSTTAARTEACEWRSLKYW